MIKLAKVEQRGDELFGVGDRSGTVIEPDSLVMQQFRVELDGFLDLPRQFRLKAVDEHLLEELCRLLWPDPWQPA